MAKVLVTMQFHSHVTKVSVKFQCQVGGFLIVVFFPVKASHLNLEGSDSALGIAVLMLLSDTDATCFWEY